MRLSFVSQSDAVQYYLIGIRFCFFFNNGTVWNMWSRLSEFNVAKPTRVSDSRSREGPSSIFTWHGERSRGAPVLGHERHRGTCAPTAVVRSFLAKNRLLIVLPKQKQNSLA